MTLGKTRSPPLWEFSLLKTPMKTTREAQRALAGQGIGHIGGTDHFRAYKAERTDQTNLQSEKSIGLISDQNRSAVSALVRPMLRRQLTSHVAHLNGNNGSWTGMDDVVVDEPGPVVIDGKVYTLVAQAGEVGGSTFKSTFVPCMTDAYACAFVELGTDIDHVPMWVAELCVYQGAIYDTCMVNYTGVEVNWHGVRATGSRDGSGVSVHEELPRADTTPSVPSWKFGKALHMHNLPVPVQRVEKRAACTRNGLDSALNGANGEVTGKDDVKVKGQKAMVKPKAKQVVRAQTPSPAALKKAVKSAMIEIGRRGGEALAYTAGAPQLSGAMGKLGAYGGTWLSRLVGMGSIISQSSTVHNFPRVNANSIISGKLDPHASYRGGAQPTYRVLSREKVCDIETNALSAGSSVILSIPLQPGLVNFYRKSSVQALINGCFKYHGLAFEFVSNCSDYASNGVIPAITLGYSLNVNQPAPQSIEAMESLDDVIVFKASEDGMMGIECKPRTGFRACYMTRTGSVPSGAVKSDYDYGVLYVGIESPSSVAVDTLLGKLYVTSDVEYSRPLLSSARAGWARLVRTGASTAAPYGTTAVTTVRTGACSDITIDTTGTILSFTNLAFGTLVYVNVRWVGGSTALTMPSRTYTNVTGIAALRNSGNFESTVGGGGGTGTDMLLTFTVADSAGFNATSLVSLSGGVPPTGAYCEVTVNTIGSSLVLGTDL